jgi:PAS domain S-box-containing protein
MLPGESPSERLVSLPRIFASLLLIGFVAETAVMFALPALMPQVPAYIEAIADSSLLTLLSAPAIWWLVIRPLRSAALREKGRAAAVITHAVDGILTLDLRNRIESCNPAGERIFGYPAGDLVGQSILLLAPDVSAGGSGDMSIARMLLNRSPKGDLGIELLAQHRDGTRFPVEFALSEVQLDHKPTFIVVARDITERKRAEEDRRKLIRAVEQSPNTVIITDATGRIEYVNPKFVEVTGYTCKEAIGR